jgi:aryl-alcohol dehydrogenase-like predicted oxidoreductase
VPALLEALADDPPPAAAQIVTNALVFERSLVDAAVLGGTAVVGIQPTHSGALTDAFDRPVAADLAGFFSRAKPFRVLAAELGEPTAELAHRYALSLPSISTVTLGVKNRVELREALAAETAGPLSNDLVARIAAATG